MQGYQILAESGFFKDLSRESLKALGEIAGRRELKKKETLFREGEAGRAIYLLRRGAIQLHKSAPDGSEVVIKVVQPSETFAEVILFEQDRYPVTAVALTESEVLVFPRLDVHRLLGLPAFRHDFIAGLMRKQRYLAERIVQLTKHSAEERLLWFLREQYGEGPVIRLNLSKKDIAAAVGATPETVSRLILRLRKRKVLNWSGKTLTWLR